MLHILAAWCLHNLRGPSHLWAWLYTWPRGGERRATVSPHKSLCFTRPTQKDLHCRCGALQQHVYGQKKSWRHTSARCTCRVRTCFVCALRQRHVAPCAVCAAAPVCHLYCKRTGACPAASKTHVPVIQEFCSSAHACGACSGAAVEMVPYVCSAMPHGVSACVPAPFCAWP